MDRWSVRLQFVALVGLAAAVGVSFGCEWDRDTEKRFEKGQKAVCKAIESASKEKEKCNTNYAHDQTLKEQCLQGWDEDVIKPLTNLKGLAGIAFAECDSETLDRLKELMEKLIDKALEKAGKKVSGFALGTRCGTNFADPAAHSTMTVALTATQVAQAGTVRTYVLGTASHWTVSYDGGGVFETYPASGSVTFDVQTAGVPIKNATLVDLDVALDLAAAGSAGSLSVRENATNPISFALVGALGSGNLAGTLCGWLDYALDSWTGKGSASTKLRVTFSPMLDSVTIASGPGVDSSAVFPEDPPPTGNYVYYATFSTPVVIGQTATIEVHGLESGAPIAVYASPHLSAPTGTFAGVPWDLDQSAQFQVVSGTADASGVAVMNIAVPPDPNLVGSVFFFQGLASLQAGLKPTIEFSSIVEGP